MIKEIAQYELHLLVETIKKTTTWIYLFSLLAIVFAIYKQMVLIVIAILVIIILQAKKDYDAGKVKAFQRQKYLKETGSLEGTDEQL